MENKMDLYNLYHIYESEDDEIVKLIGVFSSIEKVNEVISILMEKPGFINFPKESFQYFKVKVNDYGWQEGFCSWEQATD